MSEPRAAALLGAGIMANAVAARLDAHGFELRRYNRTLDAIDGPAVLCATPAQAAEEGEVVWSFVHDDAASAAVWFGPGGALAAARGAVVIESSTLSPGYAEHWMREAVAAGARPVLAPVTGSRAGALNGTLVAFTAGSAEDLAAAEPWLRTVAAEVVATGDARATATTKLLNNALAAVILTGLAETLTAAQASGLDTGQLLEVWSRYGWAAPVADAYGVAMLTGEHPPTDCSVAVLAKDLRHTVTALDGHPAPLITAADETFSRAMELDLGGREMSAIIDATRRCP
ncbi:NAD(P)-dependent oxidoreductase [Nocardia sp. NPDC057227]|uniref:NAD(P)-dependent oxidoreductase n=1 Tax=Nocardia sp. NPDC057227 TaxID=3346056 RepID=UPI0036435A45